MKSANKYRTCDRNRGMRLIEESADCWSAMSTFRSDRRRHKRYTYGDQWSDTITVDGIEMTEEQYIRSQGNIPLKNNLIRRLVRNVLGVYRDRWKQPEWPFECGDEERKELQKKLNRSGAANDIGELYARSLEEFLISGVAIHRKSLLRKGVCLTQIVAPDKFFIDKSMLDVRCRDVSIIGEIHDMEFSDLCRNFASSAEECEELRSLCGSEGHQCFSSREFGMGRGDYSDFFHPLRGDRCRVIEVWRRENRIVKLYHDRAAGRIYKKVIAEGVEPELSNGKRSNIDCANSDHIEEHWRIEKVWCYYFLTPEGIILREGISPYPHGDHPYIFKAYPFIDGEIHSFVGDVIDQQRYANRLITLYDWVMRASAKGVLLFPEDALPPGVDIDDISSEWSRFNGVILYRPQPDSPLPQQVNAANANTGITDLLNIQLKMLEDISGVNGALQGNVESNTMSGKLFESQTQNALTALSDLLCAFRSFERCCTAKEASLLMWR